ncbi:muconolactone Delta-isomerase [Corynebacterium sp.]|uniref:muconolactone Delta-isomerase n=1 Tax=Corynebacterium sp. TaxID=1720 RepID=UPI0028AC6164|nr:muconolactone Delta-isomerase [Corynebacterium sp.]
MLFLARMDVHFPDNLSPSEVADFQRREKEYSGELQKQGVMKAIWRVVGEYANYSVFDVDDHDELHTILQEFPMFAHMSVSVTALARHPNALEYYLKN